MSNIKAALYRFDKALQTLDESAGKVRGISHANSQLKDEIRSKDETLERVDVERERVEAEHKEQIQAFKAERARLEISHQEKIDSLQDDQMEKDMGRQKSLVTMEQDHAEAVKALESEHRQRLEELRAHENTLKSQMEAQIDGAKADIARENGELRDEVQRLHADKEKLEKDMVAMREETEMLEGLTDQVTGQLDTAIKEIRTILEQ